MNDNFNKRAMLVKALVDEHYVPNSHRACQRYIFRHVVVKVYPMSERTFRRYMCYAINKDGYIGNGANRVFIR